MNRRKFCIAGAATAVSLGGGGKFWSSIRSADRALSLPAYAIATARVEAAIFDTRFSPSRAFGAAAARSGRRTVGFAGDVTALWFHDLGPGWRRGRGAVAGMTTLPALFCLEQLAKDHWMRVKVRIGHPAATAGIPAPSDEALVSWIIAA